MIGVVASVIFSRPKVLIVLLLYFGTMLLLYSFLSVNKTSAGLNLSEVDTDEHYPFDQESNVEFWPGYEVKLVDSHTEDIPIIVWWTDNGSLQPHDYSSKNAFTYFHLTCHNGAKCYTTTDRDPSLLKDRRTRGFLFYGTDVDPYDLPLPRLKHHEWALIHEESPLNSYKLTHYELLQLFNHTSTFRRESDYPLSTQYIFYPDYLVNRKPVSTERKNEEKKAKGLSPVVYVQSSCDTPSDRDSYVKELMKYIDVDSYGACLNNKDLPNELRGPSGHFFDDSFHELLSVYKFYIAFENAYCNDYMTEKIMRPLHLGVVPVYKGSPVIQDWVPNEHSVILVDDFKSPKHLADFLKHLDQDDDAYDKYLDFKYNGIQNNFLLDHLRNREWSESSKDFFRGFECHLCKQLEKRMHLEKLHAEDLSIQLLPPKIAAPSHLACPEPKPLDLGQGRRDSPEAWPKFSWTSHYWEELLSARAVKKMVETGESDSKKFAFYLKAEEGTYIQKN